MKIGIIVRTGPYSFEDIDTVYELSKSAVKKRHNVSIFFYEDGVINLNKNIQSPGERNIPLRIKSLIDLGIEIAGCGNCAKFRGIRREDLIEGAKLAGMAVLNRIIEESDRFLSFGC